jgi:hypothetical protein
MLNFTFRYISALFNQEGDKNGLVRLNKLLKSALNNLIKFDPVKKVPVYDQQFIKPQTDTSLIRITHDIFIKLFSNSSETLQSFYSNKISLPTKLLA